ncbi:MAG: OmpH family outer membrane protein [Spirochaetales bacterium]|nr:MAG: OmpH family outer membrane protein [Spirochaetales bacterium]
MNKTHIHRALFLGILLSAAAAIGAQELRTVAVFDANKVVLNFYQDSSLYRDYRRAEEQYRADLLVIDDQITRYQERRTTALNRNDARTAQTMRENIRGLEEDRLTVQERWGVQSEEFVNQLAGDDFWSRMYDVVGYLAEDMGYTLVLDSTVPGLGVFWVSSAIDITDEIIEELLVRYR